MVAAVADDRRTPHARWLARHATEQVEQAVGVPASDRVVDCFDKREHVRVGGDRLRLVGHRPSIARTGSPRHGPSRNTEGQGAVTTCDVTGRR